jgi:TRAP-type C4-dicarboxylate transport system permease large subunit
MTPSNSNCCLTCLLDAPCQIMCIIRAYLQSAENSVPPTLLATLITAQHARPFQAMPMLFPPVLIFSSYLNLSGYKTDAAGITAAWSGLYALLAVRRSQVSQAWEHDVLETMLIQP